MDQPAKGKTMDALEAIFNRHSVSRVKPDPVPKEVIERLLAAAVQAPNHYRIQPWRFIVLTGRSREALGEVMARSLQVFDPDLSEAALLGRSRGDPHQRQKWRYADPRGAVGRDFKWPVYSVKSPLTPNVLA